MFKRLILRQNADVFCPGCGRRAGVNDRFCTNCAYRLTTDEPDANAMPSENQRSVEPMPKATEKPAAPPSLLWEQIRTLSDQTLQTLRGKPFDIISVGDDFVTIVPQSSGKPRPIRRQEIEKGYAFMRETDEPITSSSLRKGGASEVNPVYVLAILKAIGATKK